MRTVLSGLTRIVSLAVSLNLIRAQSEPPCSPPEPIKNGLTDWDGKSGVARYACFQGYHLVGPPRVECRYGDWYAGTPVSLPSCKPIVCNHPTIESGSLVTGESVRYRSGEEAEVECNDGFELKMMSNKIICREDGSWASAEQSGFPTCREKTCDYPDPSIPVIENGSLEINGNRQGPNGGYKPGSVALYHCHPGYALVPLSAGKRVCHKGKWEGNMPACISQAKPPLPRTHCPSPLAISNGYYFTDRSSEAPLALPKAAEGSEQYERGTIARYRCKEGYTLSSFHGQKIYRCQSNGEWSPKVPPVCISFETSNHNDPLEQVMCPSPPPIPYADFERVEGWLTSNGAIHGTTLEYSCRVGYRDSRTPCLPTRRTCHAGTWIGKKPSCVPFDYCERPPIISHGFMKSPPENAYHVLSEVYYSCHAGFNMKGPDHLKCHATGCWMPNDLPECIREDLYESGWGVTGDDSQHVPLIAVLISISIACSFIAIFTTFCLIIVCKRKGGSGGVHQSTPGPAHWSTTVTVTPECRPREPMNGSAAAAAAAAAAAHAQRRGASEQDRMALIAFADGVQQVTLPSYEDALRDTVGATSTLNGGRIPPEYDNPMRSLTGNGQPYRHHYSNGIHDLSSRGHHGSRLSNGGSSSSSSRSRSRHHHHSAQQQQQQQRHQRNEIVDHQQHLDEGRNSYGDSDVSSHHSSSVHQSTSWQPAGRSHGRRNHGGGGGSNGSAISQRSPAAGVPGTTSATSPRGLDGDGHSDSGASHHSMTVFPCRHPSSQSTSLRSSSGSNGSASISVDAAAHNTTSTLSYSPQGGLEQQQQQYHLSQQQQQQHQQMLIGGGPSSDLRGGDGATAGGGGNSTPGSSSGTSTSQTPSCRALAGSLASFDTGSGINIEGVPLLEENEMETEGSNTSSVSGGDTGSATYSEASSK